MYKLTDLNDSIIAEGEDIAIRDNVIRLGGVELRGISLDNFKLYLDDVEVNISDFKKDNDVDFDRWTVEEKAILKLLVKHIDQHREVDGKLPLTNEQIKTALKEALNE